MIEERIKALRKEARELNKRSKDKVKASGQTWLEMDPSDLADFQRWCDIQLEIQDLKAAKARTTPIPGGWI